MSFYDKLLDACESVAAKRGRTPLIREVVTFIAMDAYHIELGAGHVSITIGEKRCAHAVL